MFEEPIDEISEQAWQDALDAHLEWGQSSHGDFSTDTFFGVWQDLVKESTPLVINVQLDTPQPVITTPPNSSLIVENNRTLLDDGRELVLQFTPR